MKKKISPELQAVRDAHASLLRAQGDDGSNDAEHDAAVDLGEALECLYMSLGFPKRRGMRS